MKKKNLLAIHLNEFNYDFLKKGALKYKKKNILNLLKLEKVKTFTKDKQQNKNLDPWVQSVSINTGKRSKKHKIFNLGDNMKNEITQIWDVLSKKGFTCSIWGTMNSTLRYNQNIKLYFPDPWNFTDKIYPQNLKNLFKLPKYFSKNYTDASLKKIILYSILFFFSSVKHGCLKFYLKYFFLFLTLFFKKGIKNYLLFFIFDLISINIFYEKLKKRNTDFSLIFLNSLAHFQHNNWDEKQNEKYYFLFTDLICDYILKLSKYYKSVLIYNGFTQEKIKTEYILRPYNPQKFLNNLQIKYKNIEQDMTNGAMVFFNRNSEFLKASKIIKNFKVFGANAFQVTKQNNKCFFYKIQIRSFHKLTPELLYSINSSNIKKYIDFNDSRKFKFQKKKHIHNEIIFFKSINFIKCTGKHRSNGILLKNNFIVSNNRRIENHKIFDLILRHFQ